MASTDLFKQTIQAYLENRAQTDELFAPVYAKPNKNINDCVKYIYSEVQASGRSGFNDDEIYSMAVHYYDEDDIKPGKVSNVKVVVNHAVELTEDDKEGARLKAIEEYKQGVIRKMEQQHAKPVVKKEKQVLQNSLFGDEGQD